MSDKVYKTSEKKRKASAAWRAANPDKVRAMKSDWAKRNREKCRASRKAWDDKNREYTREKSRLHDERIKTDLTDKYVASTLMCKVDEVPIEIIEVQRVRLQIKRHLRNMK